MYIILLHSVLSKFVIVCFYHVTYAFQSESTLYSCLNVKELLARSRREIWRWSDCNWIRTHNHLVHKRTLNWLSVRLWTKWLWVRIQLQSLSLWCLLEKLRSFYLSNISLYSDRKTTRVFCRKVFLNLWWRVLERNLWMTAFLKRL